MSGDTEIRPFRLDVPGEAIADLRRRSTPHLIYYHQADKGGHFAAWEEPHLLSGELRAAFRPLR